MSVRHSLNVQAANLQQTADELHLLMRQVPGDVMQLHEALNHIEKAIMCVHEQLAHMGQVGRQQRLFDDDG